MRLAAACCRQRKKDQVSHGNLVFIVSQATGGAAAI
jgi:hypothetical protein